MLRRWLAMALGLAACTSFSSSNDGTTGTGGISDASVEASGDASIATPSCADGGPGKIVFVTSETLAPGGAFAQLSLALCASEAAQSGLAGSFVAWLSTEGASAADALTGNGPWCTTGGALVFASRDDFLSSRLSHAIDRTAAGVKVSPGATVFTGTMADGRRGSTCVSWSTGNPAVTGTAGDPALADGGWTAATEAPCSGQGHLYCFAR